jgi:hypothetical protein
MDTSIVVPDPAPKESPWLHFGEIIVSSIVSFIGFSLSVMSVFSVMLMILMIQKDGIQTNIEDAGGMLFAGIWLGAIYGILACIALAVPFFLVSISAAVLGWKLKAIRWWTSMLVGCLICAIPVGAIFTPPALVILFVADARSLSDALQVVGAFWGAGFCGAIAGLFFWLPLHFLKFPNMSGPLVFSSRQQQNTAV